MEVGRWVELLVRRAGFDFVKGTSHEIFSSHSFPFPPLVFPTPANHQGVKTQWHLRSISHRSLSFVCPFIQPHPKKFHPRLSWIAHRSDDIASVACKTNNDGRRPRDHPHLYLGATVQDCQPATSFTLATSGIYNKSTIKISVRAVFEPPIQFSSDPCNCEP